MRKAVKRFLSEWLFGFTLFMFIYLLFFNVSKERFTLEAFINVVIVSGLIAVVMLMVGDDHKKDGKQ